MLPLSPQLLGAQQLSRGFTSFRSCNRMKDGGFNERDFGTPFINNKLTERAAHLYRGEAKPHLTEFQFNQVQPLRSKSKNWLGDFFFFLTLMERSKAIRAKCWNKSAYCCWLLGLWAAAELLFPSASLFGKIKRTNGIFLWKHLFSSHSVIITQLCMDVQTEMWILQCAFCKRRKCCQITGRGFRKRLYSAAKYSFLYSKRITFQMFF